MSEEYLNEEQANEEQGTEEGLGPNGGALFSISDDEGNEYVLEHLDTIDLDDSFYLAFLPTTIDPEDENYGIIILKALTPEVTSDLVVPTDEETNRVYEIFLQRLYGDDDDKLDIIVD